MGEWGSSRWVVVRDEPTRVFFESHEFRAPNSRISRFLIQGMPIFPETASEPSWETSTHEVPGTYSWDITLLISQLEPD